MSRKAADQGAVPKAKKSRKIATTPRGKVRRTIYQIFNRSRERGAALKRDGYRCACGAKQSKAKGREVKVEVHHLDGGGVNEIVDLIFERLLCSPDRLKTVCVPCHHEIETCALTCGQRRTAP